MGREAGMKCNFKKIEIDPYKETYDIQNIQNKQLCLSFNVA